MNMAHTLRQMFTLFAFIAWYNGIIYAMPTMPMPGAGSPAATPPVAAPTPALPGIVEPAQPMPQPMPQAMPALPAIPEAQPAVPVAQPVAPTAPATMPPPPMQAAMPQTDVQAAPMITPTPAPQPMQTVPPVATQPEPMVTAPAAPGPVATPVQQVPSKEGPKAGEEPKDIYLNFENTELANFIDYIAELKKLNVIPDKAVEGSKISLTIREALSVEGAWNIFLTVLETAGFSIIKVGDVHKIVPKDKKLNQPLPAYINVPYDTLPDSDLMIRYVTFLTNINVNDIKPVLESMLSNPSVVHAQPDMNAFIITDKSYNIKSAAKLIHELDQMGLPETVTVLHLKRANAVDVKQLLDALIKKPEGNPLARLLGRTAEGGTEYFSPTTRVIPEERTNSLILLGNSKSVQKVIDFITTNIDTELKDARSPLHIYELQNIDAKQVMDILKEVTAMPDSATGQAAGKFGSIRGGVKYFRGMTFQVDKDGNRLIVNSVDKQDWKLLKKMISDLDKPQPQIAMECLIVTVNEDDLKALGGGIRNKKHGQIGKNIDFQSASITDSPTLEMDKAGTTPVSLLGNMLGQIAATQGQSLLTFGKSGDMWAVFRAIKTQTNASILSQPFVTVANKTTAQIEVGSTQRVASEQQGGTAPTTGYIDATASTVVKITPQINLDGVIRLDVAVEISDFENTAATKTSTKKINSIVTVADGQVLVLGGFVKTKVSETKTKTPILGDIPLLGWFFKNQQRTISKQYIFVFMSPTILKPRQVPGMQLYTKMKLHEATDDIEEAVETKRVMDPIHNWFFNPAKENYSHKVIDFANARYQPTTVDIKNDTYYRSTVGLDEEDRKQPVDDLQPGEVFPSQDSSAAPPVAPVGDQVVALGQGQIQQSTPLSQNIEQPVQPPEQPMAGPPPVPQPPVVEETKKVVELSTEQDQAILAGRKKLRELLAKNNTLSAGAQQASEQVARGKPAPDFDPGARNELIIASGRVREGAARLESTHVKPADAVTFDVDRRNKLREFLTARQKLAHKIPVRRPREKQGVSA